ncbi:quercetin dioxygenase-like cupin family protein [Sphingomonas zeicaulis]|uniref:cupin domain-containing protein n=1 Tax=Sphingomonas zeicaulis TaxID=1632740 RepID=UPI003D212F88
MIARLAAAAALTLAFPAAAQAPIDFAASAEVRAKVAKMAKAMKPDQGFMASPVVSDGKAVAALEYWRKPGRPAVHPDEAEYAIVVEGAGTLIMGGTLADPEVRRPGLTEGSRIEGGTTHKLAPGDVMLIPAGAPHWFGIDGTHLVLLGIKLPKAP